MGIFVRVMDIFIPWGFLIFEFALFLSPDLLMFHVLMVISPICVMWSKELFSESALFDIVDKLVKNGLQLCILFFQLPLRILS